MSFMDEVKNDAASHTTTSEYTLNLGGQHSVTGTYGWICPVCGRGVAPGQKYCGCRPQLVPIYPSYPSYPVYPYWWYQTTCGTASSTSDLSNSKTTYTTTGISTKVEV